MVLVVVVTMSVISLLFSVNVSRAFSSKRDESPLSHFLTANDCKLGIIV